MKKKYLACAFICSSLLTACTQAQVVSTNPTELVQVTHAQEIIPTSTPTATPVPTPEATPQATPMPTATPTPVPTPADIDYAAIKPYEVGQIMIIMYHRIVENPTNSMQRSIKDFQNDLQTLYERKFRPISMKDLIENNIMVEAGYTPVIITFDDGHPTAFSLTRNDDGELIPAVNTGVDIMQKFAEEHPEFGSKAVFYINGAADSFKGEGTMEERFKYLIDHGYEIGNHTYSHAQLSELDELGIQKELGTLSQFVESKLPGYQVISMAYPEGLRPKEELRQYILEGSYNGQGYKNFLALSVGQSGASAAPNHVKYDALNIPRVRGTDNANTDLGWTLRLYEEKPQLRYISDGDPNKISVPLDYSENVHQDSLNGKELYIYDIE